jgi:hypothetical protein
MRGGLRDFASDGIGSRVSSLLRGFTILVKVLSLFWWAAARHAAEFHGSGYEVFAERCISLRKAKCVKKSSFRPNLMGCAVWRC